MGGLEGLSLRGLAEATGVSKTAPYRHFADKHELLISLAAEGFRELADALEGAVAAGPGMDGRSGVAPESAPTSPGDRADAPERPAASTDGAPTPSGDGPPEIRALIRAYVDFARSRPALYRLMFSRLGFSLHSESCRRNSQRALDCLLHAVARAQKEGWRAEQDTRGVVLSIWAGVHGWAGLLIDGLLPSELVGEGEDWYRLAESFLVEPVRAIRGTGPGAASPGDPRSSRTSS